jgi:hypothetical protein
MATPRYKHAAVRLEDGRVMVIAGSTERDWQGKHRTTEIYDPASGRFAPGPVLSTARFKVSSAVAALFGGAVAIAGGADTVEVLDRGGSSRVVAQLGRPSYFGTATWDGSGALIVIGGYDDEVRASDVVWSIAIAGVAP